MHPIFNIYFAFVVIAALLDIVANMYLSKSKGFEIKKYGFTAIFLVLGAFTLLAQAVKGIDLAVAYATWGAIGILGTALGGYFLLGQKLKPIGWAGIFTVIAAVVVLKSA
ncbi:ligand-binding protein SH3 [Vibrio astriarenae]|uniref:Spermidine export protein MdtI n=1 Tax=Vibrio astriarenae TaxID=1481923 RepID=A0A7Z2T813_9VIBR|nr:SMR family transporter [Vibrio astriarenae]QIA66089.1 ligand-binding protein SH3 [Vibrio astriarenae]